MSEPDASLEVLIRIREELEGLRRSQEAFRETRKEAQSLGNMLKTGLGLSIAHRGLGMLTASLRQAAVGSLRYATEIHHQSRALGLTAEQYQVLRVLIEDTDGRVTALTSAISTNNQGMAEAVRGTGAAANAYRTLGLEVEELAQMPFHERLEAIARATLENKDQTAAWGAAAQLLGRRNVPELMGALRRLARDGYGAVAEEAEKAGKVIDSELAAQLTDAQQQLDDLRRRSTVAAGSAVGLATLGFKALREDPLGTLRDLLRQPNAFGSGRPGPLYDRLAGHLPEREDPPPRGEAHIRLMNTEKWIKAMHALQMAQVDISDAADDMLITEAQRRERLLPLLVKEHEARKQLHALALAAPLDDDETEEERALLRRQLLIDQSMAERRVRQIHHEDSPRRQLGLFMEELTNVDAVTSTLLQGVGRLTNSLANDFWEMAKGTRSWGDAWRNVGDIAGRVLTEIMVRLYIIRPLMNMLGFGAPAGNVVMDALEAGPLPDLMRRANSAANNQSSAIKGAGGGTFMTRGPTHLTVGDNPGGVELVSVLPLSGVGTSTVAGQAMAMAGGGSLLAMGAGAGSGPVVGKQEFNFDLGGWPMDAVTRAVMVQLQPQLKGIVADAVREAIATGEL